MGTKSVLDGYDQKEDLVGQGALQSSPYAGNISRKSHNWRRQSQNEDLSAAMEQQPPQEEAVKQKQANIKALSRYQRPYSLRSTVDKASAASQEERREHHASIPRALQIPTLIGAHETFGPSTG